MCFRAAVNMSLLIVVLLGSVVPSAARRNSAHELPSFPNRIAAEDEDIDDEFARDFVLDDDCSSDVCSERIRIDYMPFGCEGKSNNPHKSSYGERLEFNDITAKSTTSCKQVIRRVSVANVLYRNHLVYWGEEGRPGYDSRRDGKLVEAIAVTACNNDLYLVTASHTLTGYNDKTYFGASGKKAAVNCSS